MDRDSGKRRGPLQLVASGILALVVLVIVLDVAGIPAPVPSGGSAPTTQPANPHRLVSNNLKIGDALRLDMFTLPQSAVWVLASSNSGPSYLGPYFTDLGSDWFVLQGPAFLGGGSHLQLSFPVPYSPGLVGLEFVAQSAVISPMSADVAWSNSVTLRGSQAFGKNILILRQTAVMAGMTNAAQQADSLAMSLQLLGNRMTVVDDVLPPSLLDYDCILDLRFSVPPAADEAARLVQFMKTCGGVFFVVGPYAGCPPGQQRAAWLNGFLNGTLGLGVMASSGGNLSNGSIEAIDPTVDPGFLNTPLSVEGLAFDVTNEGGNFGPPGAAAAGIPWLSGNTIFGPVVYGMFFDPVDMAQTVGGRVGVLFSGGPNTLLPTAASPYPDMIMCNVAYYLDR